MELEIIAFLASTLGVGGCLPQIIKILKTKETAALSYSKYLMGVLAGMLWVAYGLMAPVYSIVFWNSISTVMAVTVVALKFYNEFGVSMQREALIGGRVE
ncbi:MAG: SemiSWEET family transporter [Alphaproteobacteria bacterium]|nr:SemiSWEET family transporter [Alphaproteobacteria bacterium]